MRARKEGIEGNVVVLCNISKEGLVKNINVNLDKSTHHEVLINEIKRAITITKFNDLKEDTTVELTFNFKLED